MGHPSQQLRPGLSALVPGAGIIDVGAGTDEIRFDGAGDNNHHKAAVVNDDFLSGVSLAAGSSRRGIDKRRKAKRQCA